MLLAISVQSNEPWCDICNCMDHTAMDHTATEHNNLPAHITLLNSHHATAPCTTAASPPPLYLQHSKRSYSLDERCCRLHNTHTQQHRHYVSHRPAQHTGNGQFSGLLCVRLHSLTCPRSRTRVSPRASTSPPVSAHTTESPPGWGCWGAPASPCTLRRASGTACLLCPSSSR